LRCVSRSDRLKRSGDVQPSKRRRQAPQETAPHLTKKTPKESANVKSSGKIDRHRHLRDNLRGPLSISSLNFWVVTAPAQAQLIAAASRDSGAAVRASRPPREGDAVLISRLRHWQHLRCPISPRRPWTRSPCHRSRRWRTHQHPSCRHPWIQSSASWPSR